MEQGEGGEVGRSSSNGSGRLFIVVGAGASGCVLANRLVRAGERVLLVEGGPGDGTAHRWPAFRDVRGWLKAASRSWGGCSLNQRRTVGQVHLGGRELPAWGGKGGGGSTLVNAGLYMRGRKADYNSWPWTLADIEKSFEAAEADLNPVWVPAKGPARDWLDAFSAKSGKQWVKQGSLWTNENEMSSGMTYSIREEHTHFDQPQRRRCTAWEAFVQPILGYPNFDVCDNFDAHLILWEGQRAVGIEGLGRGELSQQLLLPRGKDGSVLGEIILCCGAVGTPRLLMLSGVGPAEDLRRVGIDVEQDVTGVGQGLMDHVLFPMAYLAKSVMEPGACGTAAHVNTRASNGCSLQILIHDNWNVVEDVATLLPWTLERPGLACALARFLLRFLLALSGLFRCVSRFLGKRLRVCTVCVTGTVSTGCVRLASSEPRRSPLIDPNYLAHEKEWQAVMEGHALIESVRSGDRALLPGAFVNGRGKRRIASLRRFVKVFSLPYFHLCGTCRMPSQSDTAPNVVDEDLRVLGRKGLRIADASVACSIPSTPTQAMCMMIGDRAASLILTPVAFHPAVGSTKRAILNPALHALASRPLCEKLLPPTDESAQCTFFSHDSHFVY